MVTPCGVLYQSLGMAIKDIKYDEIDSRIISRDPIDNKGRSPFERITTTSTFRTREIIQKNPHELDSRLFRKLHLAVLDTISYLKHCGLDNKAIVDFFSGDAADIMIDSLKFYGFDHHIFRNAMNDIIVNNDPKSIECATAVMTLFMATSFNSDPKTAFSIFLTTMKSHYPNLGLDTKLLDDSPSPKSIETDIGKETSSYPLLALVRYFSNDTLGTTFYRLNPGEDGTVVGRVSTGNHAINDVDSSVSRRHLLIQRDKNKWYAKGLNSTNGSSLLHPDGRLDIIETPKGSPSEAELKTVRIQANDILRLGPNTQFLVTEIKDDSE